jgi:hypothetical protein
MSETSKHTVSRRSALGLLGAGAAAPLLGTGIADAAPQSAAFVPSVGSGATPVQGLHLTFGRDPSRQMVVSWITEGSVGRPRVLYGTLDGGFGAVAQADTRTYVDGTSGRTVWIRELHPSDQGHRHRHRDRRSAVPPAQRRPLLREP